MVQGSRRIVRQNQPPLLDGHKLFRGNQIDGVRAEVNLAKGSAKISYDRTVGDDVLRNAVEKIGYHVTSIS